MIKENYIENKIFSLLAKLPKLVNNRILRGVEYNNAERDEIYDKFMNKFFNLLSEEGENLKKSYIFLEKVLGKKKHLGNPNVSKKLTYHKRRELGLYTLGKKSLKYKDLLPLHELWKEYMTKYLNLNELRAQK